MLGQSIFSRDFSTTADNRMFVYEVTGLQQNEANTNCEHQIRTSSSTFVQVPLRRMNATMQRIVNLGGKIVNIRPLGLPEEGSASSEPNSEKHKKSKH
jgi:phycocyanin-associated, rod